jgi:hypothetical protein
MQYIGNIILILSLIVAVLLYKMIFMQKMPGGDAGVGYAMAMLSTLAFFWICIALVACIIGFGGGFAWLSLGRFAGGGMLVLSFLVILLGVNLGAEASFMVSRWLGTVNAVATPLVLMAAFAILLNQNLKMSISPTLVKWGLGCVLAVNSLMLAAIFFGAVVSKVSNFLPRSSDKLDDFQLGILDRIEKLDTSEGINSLFIYTGENQPPQIREKALLKIKSKPGWEEDLLLELEGDYAEYGFAFLLANEVEDRPRFAKGVYQGILSHARMIRESLRKHKNDTNVRNDLFGFEVRQLLKVVEKFKDLGVDFKPAMQELRAAYDASFDFDQPDFYGKKAIDKWLKKH